MSFGGIEEIFNPSAAKAREELERQQTVGEAAPSPTDPPDLDDPGSVTEHPHQRFRGKVVIRRPPEAP